MFFPSFFLPSPTSQTTDLHRNLLLYVLVNANKRGGSIVLSCVMLEKLKQNFIYFTLIGTAHFLTTTPKTLDIKDLNPVDGESGATSRRKHPSLSPNSFHG